MSAERAQPGKRTETAATIHFLRGEQVGRSLRVRGIACSAKGIQRVARPTVANTESSASTQADDGIRRVPVAKTAADEAILAQRDGCPPLRGD
jgi:hypothetical protein